MVTKYNGIEYSTADQGIFGSNVNVWTPLVVDWFFKFGKTMLSYITTEKWYIIKEL